MVAYVEKARKTSLSIMCTTSAIFIQTAVNTNGKQQIANTITSNLKTNCVILSLV